MAQSAEQLIERFSQLGEPTILDMPDFSVYQLDTAEIPAALSLTRAPQPDNKNVPAQAFIALTQQRDEKLLGELLQTADETLLLKLDEFIGTHALPFYDKALIAELDTIIRHQELSAVRRLFAAQLLQNFALLHPEFYGRTIKVLAACLQEFANNPADVNAELISACVTLQADELMPVIEQAFTANRVSHSEYVTASEVRAAMSVPETAFEQGLEVFMHTKELDEIRHELDLAFAARTSAAPVGLELPIGNLAELDGFLHALALSPTPVGRSLWIEQLGPGLLAEQDEASHEPRLEKITIYYSVIKDSLVTGECAPNFELSAESAVMNLNSIQPWARGFLLAAELWVESDIAQAEAHEAYFELKEFLQAMAEDKPLPEQYQSLANSDYSMILQLMVQRVFYELNGMNDADLGVSDISDDDPMQGFFDNFS